jgi:hypothetical protein
MCMSVELVSPRGPECPSQVGGRQQGNKGKSRPTYKPLGACRLNQSQCVIFNQTTWLATWPPPSPIFLPPWPTFQPVLAISELRNAYNKLSNSSWAGRLRTHFVSVSCDETAGCDGKLIPSPHHITSYKRAFWLHLIKLWPICSEKWPILVQLAHRSAWS